MKNYLQKTFTLILGLALSVSIMALPVKYDQPFMKAAKSDLNKAYNALKRATADKGGHREKAMGLVSSAIIAVNNGIDYDRRNPSNAPRRNSEGAEVSSETGNFDQPNMQEAKKQLQYALSNLEKATADKGGYRVEAMRLIKEAMDEAQRGIDYDRNN